MAAMMCPQKQQCTWLPAAAQGCQPQLQVTDLIHVQLEKSYCLKCTQKQQAERATLTKISSHAALDPCHTNPDYTMYGRDLYG